MGRQKNLVGSLRRATLHINLQADDAVERGSVVLAGGRRYRCIEVNPYGTKTPYAICAEIVEGPQPETWELE